jgi:hypothetical protein
MEQRRGRRCVIDELHAWSSGKQVELFDALDTAVHKRPGAFWLGITTAGHDKTSLLGRLYASMLERQRPYETRVAWAREAALCSENEKLRFTGLSLIGGTGLEPVTPSLSS